jgi:ubiquinone/menaquinone biosynthesis C-methylase UbiE
MSAGPTQQERDRSFHRIQKYYGVFQEWERLAREDDGALEFAVNKSWIARHLPSPGARVLDLGGGPGRYSIWLAELGFRTTLADLSPDLLGIAREQSKTASIDLEAIVEANAVDLSQSEDASFDAALCMGPMYHLIDSEDRVRAARELSRVVKPGAPVFVAFLNRLQLLKVAINPDVPFFTFATFEFVRRWYEEGIFISPVLGVFADAHFAHPKDIAPFMEAHAFETVDLISSESLIDVVQKNLTSFKERQPDLYPWLLDKLIDVANEPTIIGSAGHFLYIGRRK